MMTLILVASAAAGAVLGRIAAGWAAEILFDISSTGLADCSRCHVAVSHRQRWLSMGKVTCRGCGHQDTVRWPLVATVVLAVVFTAYAWLLTVVQCQQLAEVWPATPMHLLRLPYHLVFLFLLAVVTLTDLLDYVIPDTVILLGILVGIGGATISGDLQIIHFWVNWDAEIPGLEGPYLPDWMKQHQHFHGLVWSLAGLAVGASFIGLVRLISGWILGQSAMGLGDVTLMAMIGAFMGWQPALCVIAMAPATAVVVGLTVRVIRGRGFVAFGPYLAVSALLVLSTWRWLWAQPLMLRDVFSHWPSTLGLAGGSLVALVVLLGGLRLFRNVPVDAIRS